MSKKLHKTSPEPFGDRFRFSIVYKLSLKLFLRLAGIFLAIDIIIGLLAAGAVIVYSEKRAELALDVVSQSGLPDEASRQWLRLSGLELTELDRPPRGHVPPDPIKRLLPETTAFGARRFKVTIDKSAAALDRLRSLEYIIELEHGGRVLEISCSLNSFVVIIFHAYAALLAIELLILLSRTFKDARLVRRTLEPIAELARAAQSLNKVGSRPDFDMAELAGTLAGINAARLDTRIKIDETQDELKGLAKAINDMLERINESYRAQVRFVSDASHELRTPISVIQGYANLLDRWGKKDEKTLQESINAIKEEAANMKDLVEQLLFLARGDNNTITLHIEDFRLSELSEEVVNEMRMIDGAHNYSHHPSEAAVSADRALVKQALRILLDNAIKYTPPGGNIKIASDTDGGLSRISVQDDGIGINPEAVPKIFDRFYRTDESRARATGGAGLGLSIARWITLRHGGHMEVLSREGLGTRITLVLPSAGTGGGEKSALQLVEKT